MVKYRSKYEARIAKNSPNTIKYEPIKIEWLPPTKKYTPDFQLPNGIIVEAKGRFRTAEERTKMICVRDQNPHLDIRFLFMKADVKLYKGSKSDHGEWATKNGFKWAEGDKIPYAWIRE
tara:strand:- start:300 stop:656 length:357 start_codon:yes stop_codon:yes gene_type:complete